MKRAGSPSNQGGFTLLELLVALAVFAVVAVTVFTRSGDTLSQLGGLEERTIARWIGANELAALRMSRLATNEPIPTGQDRKEVTMANRDWLVNVEVSDTAHPNLKRVEIDVELERPRGDPRQTDHVVGFIGRY
jgi:general secretion pathway protein I